MSRVDDLMAGEMSQFAREWAGDDLTLINFSDQQTDSTDAPVHTADAGVAIRGNLDRRGGSVISTSGGEEVEANADAYIPTEYDIRDGRKTGERASVLEDVDGNEYRVEHVRQEAGVYLCTLTLMTTQRDESF